MWAQIGAMATGLWLMAAPSVFGYGGIAAVNDRVVGPLAVTFAMIALSQSTRSVRWANLPLGAWLCMAPWLLEFPAAAAANALGCGLLLSALSVFRGRVTYAFAGGWRSLVKTPR